MTRTEYSWQIQDGEKATALLGAINALHGKPMFAPETSVVRTSSLPFYDNVSLVRATAKATFPRMRMSFLSHGEDIIKLDFTSDPIEKVNEVAPLRLSEDNLSSYLAFYFGSVRGDEGEMQLVESLEEIELTGHLEDEIKDRISAFVGPMRITPADGGGFSVRTHLVYAERLYRVELLVSDTGVVDVQHEHVLFSNLPTRPVPVK